MILKIESFHYDGKKKYNIGISQFEYADNYVVLFTIKNITGFVSCILSRAMFQKRRLDRLKMSFIFDLIGFSNPIAIYFTFTNCGNTNIGINFASLILFKKIKRYDMDFCWV